MNTRFLQPDTTNAPVHAAAIVATFGKPQIVDPMWRAISGDVVRTVLSCRLRPIQFVDFYARKP